VICKEVSVFVGAQRPMKMGTTRSLFPYDAAARRALPGEDETGNRYFIAAPLHF
jgi:hypothetical protein